MPPQSPTAKAQADAYMRTRVLGASPEQLRLLLLDGAIKFCTQARDGILSRDFDSAYKGFTSARDIVAELITAIAPDAPPELADSVRSVLAFIYRELVEASLERSDTRVDRVIEILQYERETWARFIERLHAERAGLPPPVFQDDNRPAPHAEAIAKQRATAPVARIGPDQAALPRLSLSA